MHAWHKHKNDSNGGILTVRFWGNRYQWVLLDEEMCFALAVDRGRG